MPTNRVETIDNLLSIRILKQQPSSYLLIRSEKSGCTFCILLDDWPWSISWTSPHQATMHLVDDEPFITRECTETQVTSFFLHEIGSQVLLKLIWSDTLLIDGMLVATNCISNLCYLWNIFQVSSILTGKIALLQLVNRWRITWFPWCASWRWWFSSQYHQLGLLGYQSISFDPSQIAI